MAYVPVTELEFDNVLKASKGWKKEETEGTKEVVYNCRMKSKPFTIKVFSSIKKTDGVSRDCGKDAIRICAINHNTETGAAKSVRVYRVPNWEERLQTKVTNLWTELSNRW